MASETNEVVEKGFFEAAFDGICEAPVESKIVAGVAAGLVALGVGVASFFGGKAYGEKCAADFDPTTKKDTKQEQPKTEQNTQQQQAQQTAA